MSYVLATPEMVAAAANNLAQIRRRRAQHFRLCKQKRHDRPPESCGYEQTCRDRAA